MNKYLKFKNEDFIKHNSADFYLLSIYSKEILDMDYLRLEEFKQFKKTENFNFRNLGINLGICSLLIYRFKSFLIIPCFYFCYFILDGFSEKDCYFCEKQEMKKLKLQKYENYYNLINLVFKNKKIRNFDEFEQELDKIIRDLKY